MSFQAPTSPSEQPPQFTLARLFEVTTLLGLALASYVYLGRYCIGTLPVFLSLLAFRLSGKNWRQTLLWTGVVYGLAIASVVILGILFTLLIRLGYLLA